MTCGTHDIDAPHRSAQFPGRCATCSGRIAFSAPIYLIDKGWSCRNCALAWQNYVPPPPPKAAYTEKDPYRWIEAMFEVIPQYALGRVYAALAFAFHPDTPGSDEECMKRVNAEYDKRRRGP